MLDVRCTKEHNAWCEPIGGSRNYRDAKNATVGVVGGLFLLSFLPLL